MESQVHLEKTELWDFFFSSFFGDDGVADLFRDDETLGFFGDEGVLGLFGLSTATFIIIDIYIFYAPQGDALQQGTEVSHCIAHCF